MIARLLISGGIETRLEEIKNILNTNLRDNIENHPDLLYIKAGEDLGIAEARKITSHFSLKPYSAKGRIVVIEDASVMTTEAQNALLKTMEELPENGLFIMGARSETYFLPTIISRCQISYFKNRSVETDKTLQDDLEKLINSSVEDRFAYVEKLKDKKEFLYFLVYFFHNIFLKQNSDKHNLGKFLNELLEAEKWAKQNVNIRGILEYLMLVMPQKI